MAARFLVGCLVMLGLCCMAAAATDAATAATALPGLAASNQRLATMMQQAAQQRQAQQASPLSLLALLCGVLGPPTALLTPQATTIPVLAEQTPQLAAPAPADPLSAVTAAGAAGSDATAGSSGLSNAEIDLLNRLLSPSDNTGPYKYDSGMPPLQQLLSVDGSAFTSSADRLRQLASLSGPISWLARTFVVRGDALSRLRLSPDLQLVIRDVMSNSLSQSADVPASQVLTFAAANVSLSLEFKGVGFGSTDSTATAGNHAGLAAVRDALSQLAGGFDPRHIAVSFARGSVKGQGTAKAAASTGRRMLASKEQQQQQQQQSDDAKTLVYARYFNVNPANATSIISALTNDCAPAAATHNSSLATPAAGLVPGLRMPPICEAIFSAQFAKHSAPVSTDLSVTPAKQPQATVSLSIAVGLTAAQTADELTVNSTAKWLNSTALRDMLRELGLSVQTLPADYASALQHAHRSSSLVRNSNLSGLLSSILATPAPPAAQPDPGTARGIMVSKGRLAGIIVAAATCVLALLGVALLLALRRPHDVQRAGSGELPTGEANRRRRKRRVYHNKFIPAGLAVADGSAVSDAPSSSQEAAAARPHLERGDSVTSAIKFEADDDEVADSAEVRQEGWGAEGASSCSSAVAGRAGSSSSSGRSSESCGGTGSLARQRAVELQMIRAGVSDSSLPDAVEHSTAGQVQSVSVMLAGRAVTDSSGSCSRELKRGPLLPFLPWQQGSEAADEKGLDSKRLQQLQQTTIASNGSSSTAAAHDDTSGNVAAVFAAMESQLAAKGASSRPAESGVQPLGHSCWHAGSRSAAESDDGSSSRCSLNQRQGGWPAALPHEQQLQRQRLLPHNAAAASPFANQEQPQRCTSRTMVSPFALQQQGHEVQEEEQQLQQQQQHCEGSSGQVVVLPYAAANMLQ